MFCSSFPKVIPQQESGNVWWQDTCAWQGIGGGRVPRVVIEVGLSRVWHHLLPRALNSCSWAPSAPHDFCSLHCRNCPDTVTVKLLLVRLVAFCAAEGLSHCGIWGLRLSGNTKLALHLGLRAALLLKKQLSFLCDLLWSAMDFTCWRLRNRSFNNYVGFFTEPAFMFFTMSCLKKTSMLQLLKNSFLNWIVEKCDISILRLST